MENRSFSIKEKQYQIAQNLEYKHAGTIWDAAICLIKYMEKNFNKLQPLFYQKNILELGTGTGVIGLCIDEFKPNNIILTDMKDLLPPVENNVQVNQNTLSTKVLVEELLWGKEHEKMVDNIINKEQPIDIIIGSDLSYVQENTNKLFETFEIFYKKSKKERNSFFILLAYTVHKPGDDFFLEQYKDQWIFEPIKYREYNKDYRSDDIGIVFIKPNFDNNTNNNVDNDNKK